MSESQAPRPTGIDPLAPNNHVGQGERELYVYRFHALLGNENKAKVLVDEIEMAARRTPLGNGNRYYYEVVSYWISRGMSLNDTCEKLARVIL
jgi:hypothetical protein